MPPPRVPSSHLARALCVLALGQHRYRQAGHQGSAGQLRADKDAQVCLPLGPTANTGDVRVDPHVARGFRMPKRRSRLYDAPSPGGETPSTPVTPSDPAKLKRASKPFQHNGEVLCAAATLSGVYAATGGADGEIKVFWIREFREDRVLLGHCAPVTALAFSEDDMLLVSGDANGTVLVRHPLPQHMHISWS